LKLTLNRPLPELRKVMVLRGLAPLATLPKSTWDASRTSLGAWAELESLRLTGDKERLAPVWEPLARYHAALQKYLRQGNGLYMTDWASMDNATRNKHLEPGGCGIDISCEMVLFARNLAQIADILGQPAESRKYREDAEELSTLINRHMWDEQRKFYFDLTSKGRRAPVKSIAGFWALLAKVASKSQAEALAAELEHPETFKTTHRVPTLAANEPGFDPKGGYWVGAVWAPTDKMVMAGLENYGYRDLAREIALNHLRNVVAVFKETGTIWENYAPQQVAHGEPAKGDFVGWSGIGPIAFFIEYAIGIRADAAGVRTVTVKSDGEFDLAVTLQGKTQTIQVPRRQRDSTTLVSLVEWAMPTLPGGSRRP